MKQLIINTKTFFKDVWIKSHNFISNEKGASIYKKNTWFIIFLLMAVLPITMTFLSIGFTGPTSEHVFWTTFYSIFCSICFFVALNIWLSFYKKAWFLEKEKKKEQEEPVIEKTENNDPIENVQLLDFNDKGKE